MSATYLHILIYRNFASRYYVVTNKKIQVYEIKM
jgi:hypothetical protein